MIYMTSVSGSNGQAQISVYFESGYDINIGAVDIQNRVSMAMPQLPVEVQKSGVQILKTAPNILQLVAVQSDNPEIDTRYLSNWANINLLQPLQRINGVGNAMLLGPQLYSMRIWLDPRKMDTLNITSDDINNAISNQNKQVALGQIGYAPNPDDVQFQYIITGQTRLNEVKEFEDIIVRADADGTIVRIKDIARVELGSQAYGFFTKLNKKPVGYIGIYQEPGANALDIAKQVSEVIESVKPRFPDGLHVTIPYDTTIFVRVSMEEVAQTLIEAVLLVVLVTFIFLQSWRNTLIPTIAVPVSIIGTFALMSIAGFSINTLTLFGMILAIGIVVDDGIIVVENVTRILEEEPDLSVKDAAIKAMKEIFSPIALSVLISAINALTLSPALAASMLKRKQAGHKDFVLFDKFNQGFNWFTEHYASFLRVVIKRWYVAVGIFLVGLGITVFLFKTIPTGFIPEEDQGLIIVYFELQHGASINQTEKKADEIENLIREIKGVKNTMPVGGNNILAGSQDSSACTVFVSLEPWSERTTKETSANGIIQTIKDRTKDMADIKLMAFNLPAIPGIGTVGGFEMQLVNYQNGSLNEFADQIDRVMQKANTDPKILYATTTFNVDYPMLNLLIDRDKAQTLDVDIGKLFSTIQTNFGSSYINDWNKFGQVYQVYTQADMQFRAYPDDVSKVYVQNRKGAMVPLSSMVKVVNTNGPNNITHYNAMRAVMVNGVQNIFNGYGSSDAMEAMEEISNTVLPKEQYGYAWTGESLQEVEAGNAAMYIFMLSVFVAFLFLAAQYESWVMPVMIMLPIPVVFLGVLVGNLMTGTANNTYTQIGMVLLIGMASKNAILIVEFAKDLHEQGMDILEAAILAAKQRLRPILMTIFAFLLGVFPLVIASGAGASSRHSIGDAVFGGMIVSTIITLLFTPVLFVLLERLRERNNPQPKTADTPKEVTQ
jgi:HAE1 family hydrophobic/amphiphilic exporter-1